MTVYWTWSLPVRVHTSQVFQGQWVEGESMQIRFGEKKHGWRRSRAGSEVSGRWGRRCRGRGRERKKLASDITLGGGGQSCWWDGGGQLEGGALLCVCVCTVGGRLYRALSLKGHSLRYTSYRSQRRVVGVQMPHSEEQSVFPAQLDSSPHRQAEKPALTSLMHTRVFTQMKHLRRGWTVDLWEMKKYSDKTRKSLLLGPWRLTT